MATAVLDLEFNNLPDEIKNLSKYKQAFLLIRFNKKPIGHILIQNIDGKIDGIELRNTILNYYWDMLCRCWTYDFLKFDDIMNLTTIPKATIAVCTRDRPNDLKRCLDALMQLPDDGQEYLVIDNCSSSDATKRLVSNYRLVRYVYESRCGLNIARNRALKEAKNDIVAFIDDDAVADPDWLRSLIKNFSDPLVIAVTGLVLPLELETVGQEQFEKHYSFGKGYQRKMFFFTWHNPLITGVVGAGANMALRRDVLFKIGGFAEELDIGTPTRSGGDHEIFARIMIKGYKIVYDPTALAWHCHRKTIKELQKVSFGYGVGVYSWLLRELIKEGELGVFSVALSWFINTQFPNLLRSIRHKPDCIPLSQMYLEILGCLLGPLFYIYSSFKINGQKEEY